uniref:HTH_Tnp_Tc3_2 domain-containing protein n=1 Tax=Heterorhabditis bacteriophora TaxID=37862 RepID=A0A1I7W980_HETBA
MPVQRIVKRYHELSTVENSPKSGRRRSVNTSKNYDKRSMRKLTSDLTISPTSMRRIVKHELRFHPHVDGENEGQPLRKKNNKKLLSIVQQGHAPNVLFTDEEIFTVNSTCNSQNSGQLLQRGHQRSEKASKLFPIICHALGRNNHITYSSVSICREKCNGFLGFQTFQITVLDISTGLVTTKTTVDSFQTFRGRDIWPSNPSDLNPMNFAIWSILENKLNRTPYNNLDTLKVDIVKS